MVGVCAKQLWVYRSYIFVVCVAREDSPVLDFFEDGLLELRAEATGLAGRLGLETPLPKAPATLYSLGNLELLTG